jgi:hypothetical protein
MELALKHLLIPLVQKFIKIRPAVLKLKHADGRTDGRTYAISLIWVQFIHVVQRTHENGIRNCHCEAAVPFLRAVSCLRISLIGVDSINRYK